MDEYVSEFRQNPDNSVDIEPFPLDKIALVRLMPACPQRDSEGYYLQTSLRTRNEPRCTLHFCLNGPIGDASAGQGNWRGDRYAVVTNCEAVMYLNPSSPLVNLFGSDTFFAVPPDQTFRLPADTIIVAPESDKVTGTNMVTYKDSGFSEKDIRQMYISKGNDPEDESKAFTNGKLWILDRFLGSDHVADMLSGYAKEHDLDETTIMPPIGPPFINPDGAFTPEFSAWYQTRNQSTITDAFYYYSCLWTADTNKRIAISSVLRENNYPIYRSEEDGWIDPTADTQLRAAADKLEVSSERHDGTIYQECEDVCNTKRAAGEPINPDAVCDEIGCVPDKIPVVLRQMIEYLATHP